MLHPIRAISTSLPLAADRRVPLEHTDQWPDSAPSNAAPTAVDPAQAIHDALTEPLDYPPLIQATVPGDRVAIAINEEVPCAESIVRGSISACEYAGVELEAISVVTADAGFGRRLRSQFDNGCVDAIQWVFHDPDDPHDLCPLGFTEKQEPLLVNRTIYDADIVLPIGCARLDDASVYSSLFPRFSSAELLGRHWEPAGRERDHHQVAHRRAADEAGWLLGASLVVQVVPGPDGAVTSVLAGEPATVVRDAQQHCRRQWSFRAARRASLVIATVTGDAQVQNWENMGRALAAAGRLVEDGGAIAICSDFDRAPGRSLNRLKDCYDLAAAERRLLHDRRPDSWPAWQLACALQRGPVYFLSQWAPEMVEQLGLAPVADLDELARLASHHESCIVLDDAHYAIAAVGGEDAA